MDPESGSVKMFFFPFVLGGRLIPMIDTARVFASHGATSTIITPPLPSNTSLQFQKSITRDQQSGLPITIHSLKVNDPAHADITNNRDIFGGSKIDTSVLLEPLRQFLIEHRADCIVVDTLHRWAGDVVNELEIPILAFTGSGCFPRCVDGNIRRRVKLENLSSDSEPFIVPGLPHKIEMTMSQLRISSRNPSQFRARNRMKKKQMEGKSFGTVINSFYDLEPAYADYIRNKSGGKAWLVGPVSLCNRNAEDKTERGKLSTIDEKSCLNWLNSKEPNSVLYVSFGSVAKLPPEQLKEIAYGLESSDQSFIWVVGKIKINSSKKKELTGSENWLPYGFEQRMKESNKGLIFKGWAPQLLILEHASIGGFMTHCGWNSTLEGVSAGLPMITWPLSAEQFTNEKLITNVLRIGVQVGSREWVSRNSKWKEFVGRDKVELAVKKLMVKSEEAEEMRKRVKVIAGNATRAVEEGGTSYDDVDALIQELKAHRLANQAQGKIQNFFTPIVLSRIFKSLSYQFVSVGRGLLATLRLTKE